MPSKSECVAAATALRVRSGVEASDENLVATVHLMNHHGIDQNAALDQSSRTGGDHGIDAWHYDDASRELIVYQSKLSDSKILAARGFSDLLRALKWLEEVIVDGQIEHAPTNHSLFNLYTKLAAVREDVRKIHFSLLSPFDSNQLEDLDDYGEAEASIIKSRLNKAVRERKGGRISLRADEYELERAVPAEIKTYTVERIPHTRINLRANAHLDLAYLSLHSLVQLYRQRGDVLFDKNVRLSLIGNKESRDRLVNPMDATLDAIVNGKLSPAIFSFYHIGVTLAASTSDLEDDTVINLEAPSVINGCQTIVIASEYLRKLERQSNPEALERFRQIRVIAKVVAGTTNEELKEITNSNNRQNPIDNWQLFSNEPVHIEIEAALKEVGVFYERQRGKYDSVMKNTENAKFYPATNGTYIKVSDLAQITALARGNIPWAAKPSEVFINKESHDRCFDRYVASNPRDIIFSFNLYKGLRRGLNKYLDQSSQANSWAPTIFKKQGVRAHLYHLALLHFYQSDRRRALRAEHSTSLHKKAHPSLVTEVQNVFYQKTVTRIRDWYTSQSKELTVEVSKRKLDDFFTVTLSTELGIDQDGPRPFTPKAIDWRSTTANA